MNTTHCISKYLFLPARMKPLAKAWAILPPPMNPIFIIFVSMFKAILFFFSWPSARRWSLTTQDDLSLINHNLRKQIYHCECVIKYFYNFSFRARVRNQIREDKLEKILSFAQRRYNTRATIKSTSRKVSNLKFLICTIQRWIQSDRDIYKQIMVLVSVSNSIFLSAQRWFQLVLFLFFFFYVIMHEIRSSMRNIFTSITHIRRTKRE